MEKHMDLSRLNQRLRNICENGGVEFGPDPTDEEEQVRRFQLALAITQNNIKKTMSQIKQSRSVDMCFLLDATGSMAGHIRGTKDSIKKILNTLVRSQQNQATVEKIRFAVVAYRDLTDSVPLEVSDFSENAEQCIGFLERIAATGGGDVPEDVFGGLEATTKLSWSETAGTRIIFHICDAPCHGNEYHPSYIPDSYPNGDPKGRTEHYLFDQIKKLKIDYYFGEINKSTAQMLIKFAIAYGRTIEHFEVAGIEQIAGSVIQSIATSVERNVENSKLVACPKNLPEVALNPEIPDWSKRPVNVGQFLEFAAPSSIACIIDDKAIKQEHGSSVKVRISESPFAQGAERLAFYALLADFGEHTSGDSPSSDQLMVLKEPKSMNKHDKILDRCNSSCEVQTIAAFLATEFSKSTPSGIEIKFITTKTLVLSQPSSRTMTCEEFMGKDALFVKFTNNLNYTVERRADEMKKCGIEPEALDYITAFSHWTWNATKGFLIVVDLQGCIRKSSGNSKPQIWMTDPAIHCKDVTRYHPTNLGTEGIEEFFSTHQCNRFCKDLIKP